eukprot:TRINITY_DN4474_c0_g1_i4.p2 TRINITY_DN4474_c0_g1~~TRINITY_DN4474_c0_g1_i4.p2  ORF type:complete len:156 (+),score=36.83 TRINITY_DN4474_c0_g1_i4:276-743(+)
MFFCFCMGRSLQAFANKVQKDAFIPAANRMGTLRFMCTFARIKATCANTQRAMQRLDLVPAESLRVRDLTDHLYAWDVSKRFEMFVIIRDKYAKQWKKLTLAGRQRRLRNKAMTQLTECYSRQVLKLRVEKAFAVWLDQFVSCVPFEPADPEEAL